MREILFKAKRKDNGEWVEGQLFKTNFLTFIFSEVTNGSYDGEAMNFINPYYYVDSETVCQYTGLTDKNGEKIWENDICSYHDTRKDICVIRFGEYNNISRSRHIGFYANWDTFGFMFRQDLGFWAKEREIEVVGNIFDNPELLEAADVKS